MLSTYSENLKKIREELNLSAQKMADKLGVSQGSIAQYESAKREPNFNFMLQLNIILNINLNWFCTGEGEMFNQEEFKKEDMNTWFRKMLDDELKRKGLIK
ncbi:helix-turn-helix transcriptional regulator [bacterium]|nr:helix-turn-helix transcriptional regulator [bacterium]